MIATKFDVFLFPIIAAGLAMLIAQGHDADEEPVDEQLHRGGTVQHYYRHSSLRSVRILEGPRQRSRRQLHGTGNHEPLTSLSGFIPRIVPFRTARYIFRSTLY